MVKMLLVVILLSTFIFTTETAVTVTVISDLSVQDAVECGQNDIIKCVVSPFPGAGGFMGWDTDAKALTQCFPGSNDDCSSLTVDHYEFTSKPAEETFNLTFKPVKFSDGSVEFKCTDTVSTASVSPSVKVLPDASTTTIMNTSDTEITVTTGCVYPPNDVTFQWMYYSENEGESAAVPYKDGSSTVKTETSTTCADPDCGGTDVKPRSSTLMFGKSQVTGNYYFTAVISHSALSGTVNRTIGPFKLVGAPSPGPCCCWCWWGCCYDCDDDIGMCIFCWLVFILMICIILGYIVGIMIGIIWINTNCCCKCFYHCKDSDCCECCHCCGGNTYVRCKCCASWPCGVLCNINQLPFWYQILWATIIGIPVALGIYTIWRCCGREEVRYVVVEHDGNRSLGFTHGSVIITSVTPGGPADKKLKVGEHVRKIGEDSTEGKTLDEIHRMLNNRTSPTLTVSEVGSDNTRSVVMTYTQEEPLGFVVNTHTMITEVQQHGPADGKLKVGERILSINGKSTVSKTYKEIKKWLKPTSIKLTIEKVSGGQEENVLDYDQEASLGIEIDKNQNQQIVVSTVEKKSPAYRKIQKGDIILKVKGESTESMTIAEVRKKMKSSVEFKVTKDVTLLELDPDKDGSIGVEVCPASMVTSVTPGGSAAAAGIKEEDIILKINGTHTYGMNRKEILKRIEASKPNLTIVTNRGNTMISSVTGPVGIDTATSPNIVWKLAPNGPAEQSRKVKRGQRILSINGEDTDGMSQDEIREVLHLSMKSVTLKLGEGSSPEAKHTATSKSHPPNTRSSNEKSANQLPSHADGAYGGGKDTRIEMENFSESKREEPVSEDSSTRKLPPMGHDLPGRHLHGILPGIQQN